MTELKVKLPCILAIADNSDRVALCDIHKGNEMNIKDREFVQLLYSEDRYLCSYLKGCRFEHVRVLEDQEQNWWVHGVGFLGCHTWIKLDKKQKVGIEPFVKAALTCCGNGEKE